MLSQIFWCTLGPVLPSQLAGTTTNRDFVDRTSGNVTKVEMCIKASHITVVFIWKRGFPALWKACALNAFACCLICRPVVKHQRQWHVTSVLYLM